METVFFKQAELLLRVLPLIQAESVFALKGGTAINFFVRDLPRISVDIDLAYLLVNDRETALGQSLLAISTEVKPAPPSIGSILEIFLISAFCSAMKDFPSRSGKPSLCI